uniref:Uncharacterized protein n=1 Tax=Alexandrium monilatum TaxID=311494 RepID=A0A6T1L4E7_9DINO
MAQACWLKPWWLWGRLSWGDQGQEAKGFMDDDAPLSVLAKPAKLDDDTPLAFLAGDLGKPKASPKGKAGTPPANKPAPKGSPKAAGKAAGKATPKKKAAGNSSSSSSSSDSSSGSDSEWKPKPPRRKGSTSSVSKKAKLKVLDKDKGEEDGAPEDGGGAIKKRDRSVKEQVVADLLCRWWYALPAWPPTDPAYYEEELAKRSLRKVQVAEWEWVPEEDGKGRKKVYELSQFPGLFRTSNGDLVDLRPRDSCPCYANFMKKELPELFDLLVLAIENQMKELKKSKSPETQLEQELQTRLTSIRNKAYESKQLGPLKRRKSA